MDALTIALVCVLVILAVLLIVLVIIGLIDLRNWLNVVEAASYAVDNDANSRCDCRNGGDCKLIVNLDATVPVPTLNTVNPEVYPADTAIFLLNLVSVLEVPWAFELDDKNKFNWPAGVEVLGTVSYHGYVIGAVLVLDTNTDCVVFRGTATSAEWEQNFRTHQDDSNVSTIVSRSAFQRTMGKTASSAVHASRVGACNTGCRQTSFSGGGVLGREAKGNGGQVHAGFLHIYDSIKPELATLLRTSNRTNHFVAGHSLGGALATLLARDLEPSTTECHTFGGPRVGDYDFTKTLEDHLFYRLVNSVDVIPATPLSVMPNIDDYNDVYLYQHAGREERFTDNWGSLLKNHILPIHLQYLKSKQ
jgi:hypothetical protein